MSKDTTTHELAIHKASNEGSAYLLIASSDAALDRDGEGRIVLDVDRWAHDNEVSAWTSLAHARRYAAARVGRQRLAWSEATEENGDVNWTATVEEARER